MATIDIRIQRIDQLLDSLDRSPFHENEKVLRRDAENYIVDSAAEYGRAERPLEILLFERLENHQKSALLHRLAQVPVDFEFDVTAPGQFKESARS
jgi:hypothetical protein